MAHATKILPPDDSSAHSGMVAYLLHCLLQDSKLAAQRLHPGDPGSVPALDPLGDGLVGESS